MRIPLTFIVALAVLAEIATFILVGRALGVATTLALTVLAVLVGLFILRRQGVATILRIRADMAAGRPVASSLADGAALALAAILIIVPGFLTDIAAFLMLIPALRKTLWARFARRLRASTRVHVVRPARPGVLELDQRDYSAVRREDTPWRAPPGEGD